MIRGFDVFHVLEALDAQMQDTMLELNRLQLARRLQAESPVQKVRDSRERVLVKELNRVRQLRATTTIRHAVAVWTNGGSC